MHDAVGTVRAIQRSTWAQNDLDTLDIGTGCRNEVVCVQTERGHIGNAVVRQYEHGAREDVVESANHDVALYQTRLGKVDSRLIADVFGGRQHSASLDFIAFKHGHGCRCIEDLLLRA